MVKALGDRIKNNYENRNRIKLTRRVPVILRIDGKCFHTLTKGCEKPFDKNLSRCMVFTALTLCKQIQGAKCAYVQSDEVSVLITDFDKLKTDAWFDYNVQKMCSISAAVASVKFTQMFGKTAHFDSRVFNIPKEEVCNYFIWRQKDWMRNSLQMLARSHFSANELNAKKSNDMHKMLRTVDVNWAQLEDKWKHGIFIEKHNNEWCVTGEPIFTEKRELINKHLEEMETVK